MVTTKLISVRIYLETWARIKEFAKSQKMTVSDFINVALGQAVGIAPEAVRERTMANPIADKESTP